MKLGGCLSASFEVITCFLVCVLWPMDMRYFVIGIHGE